MTKKISAQLSLCKKWIDIRSVVNPDPDSVGYEIISFVLAWKQKKIYISKFHLWFFAAIVQKKTVEYSFKAIAVGWFFILIEYNPFSYNFGSRIFFPGSEMFSWIRNFFRDPELLKIQSCIQIRIRKKLFRIPTCRRRRGHHSYDPPGRARTVWIFIINSFIHFLTRSFIIKIIH